MDQKMTRAKKVTLSKNQFFHAHQPPEVFFLFLFMLWLYFHDWSPKLYEACAKLCYLRGQSFLDQNLFFCLCLPPVWCSKRLLKYGLTLLIMFHMVFQLWTKKARWQNQFRKIQPKVKCTNLYFHHITLPWTNPREIG